VIIKAVHPAFSRLLFCIGLLIGSVSCKSKTEQPVKADHHTEEMTVEASSLRLVAEEGLVYYQGIPFTGTSQAFYDNGHLAESIHYLQGIREGSRKKWFPSGQISFQANYEAGKRNGAVFTWWKTGVLRSKAMYLDGIVHGKQQQWYPSGALFKELNINQGVEEGLQRAWRENGKIYNNYEAKDGRIFGLKRATLCYELEEEEVVYN